MFERIKQLLFPKKRLVCERNLCAGPEATWAYRCPLCIKRYCEWVRGK